MPVKKRRIASMANFWNGIIKRIRKSPYIQATSKKQKPDFMHHKKEWVQLPYEGALYQSLGANTKTRRPVALRVFRGGWGRNRRRDRPKGRSSDEEAGPRTLAGASLCAACAAAGYDKKDRDALKASRSLPLRAPPMRQNLRSGWPAGALPGMRPPLPRRRPGPV